VLGIDILRRYPFTIDLERGSASLRAPAAVNAVQPTPAHPALQVSDNSPPTPSIVKVQRLRQPLAEGRPQVCPVHRGATSGGKEPNSSARETACPQTGSAHRPEGMQRRRPPPEGHLRARPGEVGARFREAKQQ
jgi:hypothetical protein